MNNVPSSAPSKDQIFLSLVIPTFNEEDSVRPLADEIQSALDPLGKAYEVIFVDDGSNDATWSHVDALANEIDQIKGLRFQRNHGKSAALQEGFFYAAGQYIVTLDADLQDDPAEIPHMLDQLQEQKLDVVSGWKKKRHDPVSKTIPSKLFNGVTRLLTGIHLHDFNCGLKIYRREVIDAIIVYGEMHRYVPVLAHNAGFKKIGERVVNHRPRVHGSTKFGASRFINGFLDLLTLLFMSRYTARPMHFFGAIGIVSILIGAVINLYLAFIKLALGQSLQDRPLLFLGFLLLVVGAQFFSIGFIGEMINKGFVRKNRPAIRERR